MREEIKEGLGKFVGVVPTKKREYGLQKKEKKYYIFGLVNE